ncbi:MAG: alpha/beta fold hydrolase [Clostridia bacterium]|nr:alpha/beta fold hydrolase [Clostridia bacterium]
MKAFTGIMLIITTFFSGFASQIDFIVNPAKYNAITLDISSLPAPVEEPVKDDYIELSEVKMHYLVYGTGEKAVILVHGNGGSANSLKEAAQYLANDYTVYLPESRCHGKSSDPGVISYDLMAGDLNEFIEALDIEKPVIIGHSDGAINAITLAALYPDAAGAIIACGANSNPGTFKPYFPLGVRIANLFKPDKLNDMMLELPDFTPGFLSKVTCPAYIVSGQFDIMWLSDTVYIHENIKGSDMAVIKGADHSSYMSHDGRQTYILAKNWLDEKGLA